MRVIDNHDSNSSKSYKLGIKRFVFQPSLITVHWNKMDKVLRFFLSFLICEMGTIWTVLPLTLCNRKGNVHLACPAKLQILSRCLINMCWMDNAKYKWLSLLLEYVLCILIWGREGSQNLGDSYAVPSLVLFTLYNYSVKWYYFIAQETEVQGC